MVSSNCEFTVIYPEISLATYTIQIIPFNAIDYEILNTFQALKDHQIISIVEGLNVTHTNMSHGIRWRKGYYID